VGWNLITSLSQVRRPSHISPGSSSHSLFASLPLSHLVNYTIWYTRSFTYILFTTVSFPFFSVVGLRVVYRSFFCSLVADIGLLSLVLDGV